jgi:GxxExxY protein
MALVGGEVHSNLELTQEDECVENLLSGEITDAAIEVHRVLGGPGLLESVYEEALCYELSLRKIRVQRQVSVPVRYKNAVIGSALRLDLLVGERVIIEVKATEVDYAIFKAQVLTYLRLSNLKLGMVLNFGQSRLIDGLTRVVNGL